MGIVKYIPRLVSSTKRASVLCVLLMPWCSNEATGVDKHWLAKS